MNSDSDDSSSSGGGAPLPDFRAQGIQLQTVAPTFGVSGVSALPQQHQQPDYLDYDPKGRGIVVTMFANAGMSYLIGVTAGGLYGFRQGLAATPSTRFRVQLNSVLNHCGRYGSRAGNTLGVFAVLYSLYEGLADNVRSLLRIFAFCSCFVGIPPCLTFLLLPPSWLSRLGSSKTDIYLSLLNAPLYFFLCSWKSRTGWACGTRLRRWRRSWRLHLARHWRG